MTIWTGRSKTELLDEWIRAIEYQDNLRRLRSAMRADEQRLGATWKTIKALDDVIAEEASRADELRRVIDAGAAAVERVPTH
jgi:hypothetical protein